MKEVFKVERKTISELFDNFVLKIPAFQRKFVWSIAKREDLIDSLNNKYPIGAITLFYDETCKEHLIVDGLQRINTIQMYLNSPASVNKFKVYYQNIEKDIKDFCSLFCFDEKKIKKILTDWYVKISPKNFKNDGKYLYQDFKLLQESIKSSGIDEIILDISIFQRLREIALKPIDITNQSIATIIYQGDVDTLSDVFSKINQKTVSLTGYEILHVMWYDYTIPTTDRTIKYLEAFKNIMINESDYVENNSIEFNEFNMYMNISSLANIVKRKYSEDVLKFISSQKKSYFKNSEIIFDIVSTIFEGTSNKVNTAVSKMYEQFRTDFNEDFLIDLNEALINTCIELNTFIYHNKLDIYSKYFYIYLFYEVFMCNYLIDTVNYDIRIRNTTYSIPFDINYIKSISEEKWFKDEFRQLNFFVDKIKELKKKYQIQNS